MIGFKSFASLAAIALVSVAAPAQAVQTAFATYSPIVPTPPGYVDIRWNNSASNGAGGTSGALYSTATDNATTAGSRLVSFSFLQPSLSPVATNIVASLTLLGSSPNIATQSGSDLIQSNVGGGFSFVSTSTITVGTNTYAPGSNLLTATFGGATITGLRGGSAADFSASTDLAQSVVYTSDFLDFSGVTGSEFTFALGNLRSILSALPGGPLGTQTPNTALRTFRSEGSGTFATTELPFVIGVPEPQTWGLMVVGFGMVGLQVRRRSRRAAIAA